MFYIKNFKSCFVTISMRPGCILTRHSRKSAGVANNSVHQRYVAVIVIALWEPKHPLIDDQSWWFLLFKRLWDFIFSLQVCNYTLTYTYCIWEVTTSYLKFYNVPWNNLNHLINIIAFQRGLHSWVLESIAAYAELQSPLWLLRELQEPAKLP